MNFNYQENLVQLSPISFGRSYGLNNNNPEDFVYTDYQVEFNPFSSFSIPTNISSFTKATTSNMGDIVATDLEENEEYKILSHNIKLTNIPSLADLWLKKEQKIEYKATVENAVVSFFNKLNTYNYASQFASLTNSSNNAVQAVGYAGALAALAWSSYQLVRDIQQMKEMANSEIAVLEQKIELLNEGIETNREFIETYKNKIAESKNKVLSVKQK